MQEIITAKAVVRIHEGHLTKEERKKVIENAGKKFFKSVQDQTPDPAITVPASW